MVATTTDTAWFTRLQAMTGDEREHLAKTRGFTRADLVASALTAETLPELNWTFGAWMHTAGRGGMVDDIRLLLGGVTPPRHRTGVPVRTWPQLYRALADAINPPTT